MRTLLMLFAIIIAAMSLTGHLAMDDIMRFKSRLFDKTNEAIVVAKDSHERDSLVTKIKRSPLIREDPIIEVISDDAPVAKALEEKEINSEEKQESFKEVFSSKVKEDLEKRNNFTKDDIRSILDILDEADGFLNGTKINRVGTNAAMKDSAGAIKKKL